MGITANINKKFQRGPFVVIRIEVTELDKLALILAAKGNYFTLISSYSVAETLNWYGSGILPFKHMIPFVCPSVAAFQYALPCVPAHVHIHRHPYMLPSFRMHVITHICVYI